MKNRVMFSAMICCLLVSFSAVAADVLRVPKDFGTIQQAIDAAPTDAIIQVSAGTYCENLVIARSDLRLQASPSGRVVLSGSCSLDPIGILITGVSNVEVKGFVVQGYEAGIWLYEVTDSRVHGNLVEGNVSGSSPKLDGAHSGQGILLERSHFNEVVQNESRENGWLGVGILNGSNNLVRANRIIDSDADHPIIQDPWCSVMIWGTSTGNRFVENEVRGERGLAVMLGPGATSGNLVAQNRIHGHALQGIWATASTFGNLITQNDARGNALYGAYDLDDWSEGANTWRRNLGSCPPDSGLCRE